MNSPADLNPAERWGFRTKVLLADHSLSTLIPKIMPVLSEEKARMLNQSRATVRSISS